MELPLCLQQSEQAFAYRSERTGLCVDQSGGAVLCLEKVNRQKRIDQSEHACVKKKRTSPFLDQRTGLCLEQQNRPVSKQERTGIL